MLERGALFAGGGAAAAGVYDGGCLPRGADAAARKLRGTLERDVLRCGQHRARLRRHGHDEVADAGAEAGERAASVREEAETKASGVRQACAVAVWLVEVAEGCFEEERQQVISVRSIKSGIIGLAAVAVLLVAAPAAFAEAGWWHLTSGTRPGYLKGGQARDEVQEIVTTPGEFEGTPATAFELHVGGQELGLFVSEPLASELGLPAANAASVQAALEGAYGKGDVQVTGGEPGAAPGSVTPLVVTSVGEDADQKLVEDVTVNNGLSSGSAKAGVTVEGQPDGEIYLTATNVGDAAISGATSPIVIADKLPHGLKAVAIQGTERGHLGLINERKLLQCSLEPRPTCTGTGLEGPFNYLEMRIIVTVEPGAGGVNEASISGGEAPSASLSRPVTVSDTPTPPGVENYELTPEEELGVPTTQAGVHPFQVSTTVMLNQGRDTEPARPGKLNLNPGSNAEPIGEAKDLNFKWPPGLIGNPTPIAQCSNVQFTTHVNGTLENLCPTQSAVGVASVLVETKAVQALSFTVPLYNLVPNVGEPARFGFYVPLANVSVYIDTSVRTGSDYGITVNVENITQTGGLVSSLVTVWGVPGDPRHDGQRGWPCLYQSTGVNDPEGPPCEASHEGVPAPFLQMPTSCTGPLQTSLEADTWNEARPAGQQKTLAGAPMPAMDGCNRAPFSPSLVVTPDGTAASTPTGLNVDVHNPQEGSLNPKGLAEPDVKDITVALPEGVWIDPAGADGLGACSEALVGFTGFTELGAGVQTAAFTDRLPGSNASQEPFEEGVNFCSDASKIGTVTIRTPLLPNALNGTVYLATQDTNPFGSLVAMYVVAEDPVSGVLVKLAGEVQLTESGQVVAAFRNNPQLPFEDAELHFFGGDRAPLASPPRCGTYTTMASFAPWTGTEAAHPSSSFVVNAGPNHTPCPGAALPFGPSLTAGTTSIQAGGFSPFTMTMSREDGNQNLKSIQLKMPLGMSGTLSTVKLCDEADANAGTCGPESEIGETIVSVGLGGDPYSVRGGKVFITGPYKGAPFGLSIVNPAKAGPFDLGKVIVRAKIDVDPETAALTITTDSDGPYKIPTMIDGIPLEIKHVNVDINRPGFTFNATNCTPTAITGTLQSSEGATAVLQVPYQVTNCAVLAFKPKLTASTSGKTSRANGASLTVKLGYPAGPYDANIARVKVELPKALPSRLTTLQKACTAAVFDANPANCPAASVIGHATATTPVLPVPLSGPAIFVSHGNESFPSLIIVLQGYGVTVHLVGSTFISKQGITSSTFKTVPDVPVGTFELTLPEGPYSALAANGNLCKANLKMPTEFLGQNGALIKTTTKIQPTGCPKTKKATHKKTDKHKTHRNKRKHGGRSKRGKRRR
jgi:hypothetical protein